MLSTKQGRRFTRRERETLLTLLGALPGAVFIVDDTDGIIYTNAHAQALLGATAEEVRDQFSSLLVRTAPYQTVQKTKQIRVPGEVEYRLHNGGMETSRGLRARALPMRDDMCQILKWFGACADIEAQKQIEAALRQNQEWVNALMNSSNIGITIAEGEQIVDANDAFLHMTGYTRDDLREGRIDWIQMTSPECLSRTFEACQELIAQQSTSIYEREYVRQDGSRLPVLVGLATLPHRPHQTISLVLDNSVRKELEQRKDAFISMASHELKTPITSLKLQTQLLRKQLEKHSQYEAVTELSKMEGPIKQLERIGELLDASRIQSGKLEYVLEMVDLDALLQEITEILQQIYPSHRILVDGAVHTSLLADRDRLGQVFSNLLGNAIKYSPEAQTVEMDLSTTEDAVMIRVHDYGIGIPAEQRDKIFERFYRASDSRQRAIPGLGMGLYIVAEIVRGHGGTITVQSEVGKGSTFTVTLPKRRDA